MALVTGVIGLLAMGVTAGVSSADTVLQVNASLTASQPYPEPGESVTFTASASGSGCDGPGQGPSYEYEFSTNGGDTWTTLSPTDSYTTSYTSTGSDTVEVEVEDVNAANCMPGTEGSPDDEASATVQVVPTLTAGTLTPSPSGTVTQGQSVDFTATPSSTGTGEPPYIYAWSFSSATGPFTDATGQTISREFRSTGTQTTWVQVSDSADPAHSYVQSISTQVSAAAPLSGPITASPDSGVITGSPVTFTAPEQGGVPPYTVTWSAACNGQYTSATGPTFTETFSSPGNDYVCAKVTDSAIPADTYDISTYVTVTAATFNTTTTPTTTTTTPNLAGCANPTTVSFALTQVTGCLTENAAGTSYSTTAEILLNGIPLNPANGSQITITRPTTSDPGGEISTGVVQLSFDNTVIYQGTLGVPLPKDSGNGTGTLVSLSASPVSLFGLKLGGKFSISLGGAGQGYDSIFTLTFDLPSVFKSASGSGGITGTGSVTVAGNGTVNFGGLNIDASNAKLGAITVQDLCFSLVPATSTVSACSPPPLPESASTNSSYLSCTSSAATGDHWDATAVIDLPFPTSTHPTQVAVFGGGTSASLSYLGGFGTGLALPIADGVDLTTLGAGVCFTSPVTIRGDLGVGLLPVDGQSSVTVNGTLVFTDSSPWSLAMSGAVNVFNNQIGTGTITLYSNGDFDFGANLGITLDNFLSLNGGVSGWVEPSANLFDIEGTIQVCVKRACVGANGVISSTGAAGCINLSVGSVSVSTGAGYTWSNRQLNIMATSCSIGSWQATKVADITSATRQFTVGPGTRGIAFRVRGADGPPELRVTGPGGHTVLAPTSAGIAKGKGWLLITDPQNDTTDVTLVDPRSGTYTVSSASPADPLAGALQTAGVLPSFSGHGTVQTLKRGTRRLNLRYSLPAGESLTLIAAGQQASQTIATDVTGHVCPGTRVSGASSRCASVSFTPSPGLGGLRDIYAVLRRAGVPVARVKVASFAVTTTPRPSRPAKLQLRRSGTTVTLRWSGSRGASRYGVGVTTSTGQKLSYFAASDCRGIRLTKLAAGTAVTASVGGVRYDGAVGRLADAKLAGQRTRGGTSGKPLTGKLCVA